MRSKPFHHLQETLSTFGFLYERHLNEAFSFAVGHAALEARQVSRHHLFEIVRTLTVWSNHHAGEVLRHLSFLSLRNEVSAPWKP